jgi:single-stranded-DNA-specific exonuclease
MEIVRRIVPAAAKALAATGLNPVLARVFASRGVASADELALGLSTLPGFATMKGIVPAATRLADAILRGEKIVIIADYDADGATACAVGMRGLAMMGAVVDFLVPNRFEYGYGLTPEIVAAAAAAAPRLIVTVDNGIASHDGVTAAAERGIEVLITDHHLPAATLPAPRSSSIPISRDALSRQASRRSGCHLLRAHRHPCRIAGTRPLHRAGRAQSREAARPRRPGHRGRRRVSRPDQPDARRAGTRAHPCRPRAARHPGAAGGCGSRSAPRDGLRPGLRRRSRLNAAGRLSDMALGIRCLLADTEASAAPLAAVLDRLNRERRDVESTMQEEALAALEARALDAADAEAYTLCLFHPDWHQGVVGIVAGRLKDRYHRPTIVFARGNGSELKGSGRSIPGFHLRDALDLATKRAPGCSQSSAGMPTPPA